VARHLPSPELGYFLADRDKRLQFSASIGCERTRGTTIHQLLQAAVSGRRNPESAYTFNPFPPRWDSGARGRSIDEFPVGSGPRVGSPFTQPSDPRNLSVSIRVSVK